MTMSPVSISIAMCTYNGSSYVQEQLESFAAQTRLPDELIVCDDGSTDLTADIIDGFSQKADFPVHLYANRDNLGATKNFEKAIGYCAGDIIVLSDQDDVWHPKKLQRIEQVLSSTPRIGAVFTDAEAVDVQLRPLGYRLWQYIGFGREQQKRLREGAALDILLKHNVVTGATLAFRAEYKPLILPIPDVWVHDGWIALLIAAVAPLVMIDEPLVYYRQHSENQIGAVRRKREDARSPFSAIYSTRITKFTYATARLQNKTDHARVSEDILSRIGAKIKHLEARASMPTSRWRRLPIALRELIALRYHRYAKGTRSFTKDLFRGVSEVESKP